MECNVHRVQNLLGKKWTIRILEELRTEERLSFNDLRKSIMGVTQKVLSQRLGELETEDLVERIVLRERPLNVRYRITPKGADLDMIFRKLKEWGLAYGLVPMGCADRNCNECVKSAEECFRQSPLVKIQIKDTKQ